MDKDLSLLLRDLKSDDSALRKSSMEQLSTYRARGAVKSLIRVAQGKLRRWIPPSWYTLEDQLNAINALSEMDNPKAHDYVMSLTKYKIYRRDTLQADESSLGANEDYKLVHSEIYYYYHPNLSGPVRYKVMPPLSDCGESKTFLFRGNSPLSLPEGLIRDTIVTAQEKIRSKAK